MSKPYEVPFELAASIASDKVQKAADQIQNILDKVILEPDVDVEAMHEKLNAAIDSLNDVQREAAHIALDIDTKQAVVEFNALAEMLDAINSSGITIDVKNVADVDAIIESIGELDAALETQARELQFLEEAGKSSSDEWEKLNAIFQENKKRAGELKTVFAAVIDAGQVSSDSRKVISALDAIAETEVKPKITIDFADAEKEFNAIEDSLVKLASSPLDFSKLSDGDIKSIADAFERAQAATASQVAELDRLKKSGQEGTDAYKELEVKIEANNKSLLSLNERLKGTSEGVKDVDKQSGALNFLAFAEGANQLKEAFAGVSEKGGEYREAIKSVSAQTGLTGDALKELEKQAKSVFVNGVGESAAEAVKIMGQARSLFGKAFQGQELTDLTVSLGKTAKAFEKDFGEVATRAASFQKSFNLSGKETGNLIALGLRDAKTTADDFLDTIGEYSPILQQAGFTAQEFVGTLTKAAGGFNLDKIADSVKETGIRLKEGDITNALNDIAANLSDRIPKALLGSLNGIAAAGATGAKSVKEVLLDSTQAIEQAFAEGKIDVKMRQKLQSAIAGTPAEEFGSDLYARVFGAPIDTNLVEAKAAAAQASIDKAMTPTGIFDKFTKGFDFVEAKASSALLPIAKAGEGIANIAPKFAAIKNALPEGAVKKFEEGLSGIASKVVPKLGGALSSLGPALANPVVLGVAASIGALALFFTQTEKGKAIFDSMKKKVLEIWEAAQPALKSLGRAIETIGGILIEVMLQPAELVGAAIGGLIDLVGSLFSAGEGDGGDGLKKFFEAMSEGIDIAQIALSGLLEAFKSFKDNVGKAIGALVKGDIGGFVDALGDIPTKMEGAFNKGVNAAAKEIRISKLQDSLTAALEVKGNLDKNNEVGKLIERYKGAKDEVTKQNLAAQIAKEVPGAVNSIKTVVDEATGQVTEVYDIAIDKAKDFVDKQNQTLSAGVDKGKSGFVELLQLQVGQLEENKAKLQEYADKIAEAQRTGKDAKGLTEDFKKQEEAVQASAEAVRNVVTQGKGLGITGKNMEGIAKQAGLGDEASKKLAGTFVKADKEARNLAVSSKVLGDAMTQALAGANGQLTTTVNALAGSALRLRELRDKLRDAKDDATRENIQNDINDTLKKQGDLNKDIITQSKDKVRLDETLAAAQRKSELAMRSSLTVATDQLGKTQSELEAQTAIFALEQRRKIALKGGERTIYDDIASALRDVNEKQALLDKQTEKLGSNKGATNLAATVADIVQQLDNGTLALDKFKVSDIKLGVSLRQGEKDQSFDLKKQVFDQVLALQESKLNIIELIVNLRKESITGIDELVALQEQLKQKRFELDVTLGIKGKPEQLSAIEETLARMEERTLTLQKDLDATMAARNELQAQLQNQNLTQEQRFNIMAKQAALEQGEITLQKKLTQAEIDKLDLQQQQRDLQQAYYQDRAAKLEEVIAKEEAKEGLKLQHELDGLTTFLETSTTLREAAIEAIKQMELDAINDVKDARLAALDEEKSIQDQIFGLIEQQQIDLAKINIDVQVGDGTTDPLVDLKKKYGVITESERKFQQTRIDATKEFEDRRKAIEKAAADEQAATERRAAIKQQQAEKIAAGESLIIQAAYERKQLETQRNSVEKRLRLAKEQLAANSTKENLDAVTTLQKSLDDANNAVDEKGSLIQETVGSLSAGLGDAFATLFTGNAEQIKDAFRGLFAMLGGALKKLGSAFIADIILQSPWLKGFIAANPLTGVALTGVLQGILSGIVGAVLNPVIGELTSFSTGGRVDSPTFAIVGDAAKLGGRNREWIFNDTQLQSVIRQSAQEQTNEIKGLLAALVSAMQEQRVVGVLRGGDMYLMNKQAAQKSNRRVLEPLTGVNV